MFIYAYTYTHAYCRVLPLHSLTLDLLPSFPLPSLSLSHPVFALSLLSSATKSEGLSIDFDTACTVIKQLGKRRQEKNFGNAGEVKSLLQAAQRRFAARCGIEKTGSALALEDFATSLEEAQSGLEQVKGELFPELLEWVSQIERLKRRSEERGVSALEAFKDRMTFIFTGNPGTGKVCVGVWWR